MKTAGTDIHELKLLLQSHLGDGLVTIVGSGLSCAEGMPSMGELGQHLEETIVNGLSPTDALEWGKIRPLILSRGLESALLDHAPTATLEAAIIARTTDLMVNRERAIVADVFSGKKVLRFSRLLTKLLVPQSGLPVITTNYDRLIEIAAEEAALGVDTMFVGEFSGVLDEHESRWSFCRNVTMRSNRRIFDYHFRNRVNVFKPHGSLDWYQRSGKPVRYAGDLELPRLIITPGLRKFRNGYDSPFDKHRERANTAIDNAARFLIIGYGFNDDHLETHLTPKIRSGVKTLLLTHTLSPNAIALAKEYSNVVAIQRMWIDGKEGSSLFVNKSEMHISEYSLWELNTFISEVLEP